MCVRRCFSMFVTRTSILLAHRRSGKVPEAPTAASGCSLTLAQSRRARNLMPNIKVGRRFENRPVLHAACWGTDVLRSVMVRSILHGFGFSK